MRRRQKKSPRSPTPSLPVLADLPERQQLKDLQSTLDEQRDEIANLDLELENLRVKLAKFEATYNQQLAFQHNLIGRVRGVVRHLEEWSDVVCNQPAEQVAILGSIAERRRSHETARLLDQRERQKWPKFEFGERREPSRAPEPPGPEEPPHPKESYEKLKAAYRQMARHYHPDLATSEAERIRFSQIMRRINELYHAGDLTRLLAMAEKSQDLPDQLGQASLQEQIDLLEERAEWFLTIIDNLKEELEELESSEIYELWRRAEMSRQEGHDLIADIKNQLFARLAKRYDEIRWAVEELEQAVKKYNKELTSMPPALKRRSGNTDIERVFDPFAEKGLVRLGLDALEAASVNRTTQRRVDWIVDLAESAPGLLRIILFTHVSQLSQSPLTGLDRFGDLRNRFDALTRDDPDPIGLEQALAELADIVEYGVRRASPSRVHLGLRYRSEAIRNATPIALGESVVRREFKRLLWVLGSDLTCAECHTPVFAIPLYYTRGLDDLRATVCPECGAIVQRYYLPKGEDVQAVLNPSYVDLDIITDWSFRLVRTSVSTQLLPIQLSTFKVGDLKKRLVRDLFDRYELEIKLGHVLLYQGKKRIREGTPLYDLTEQQFAVRFRHDAPMTESEALEILRFRIRNRFK